MTRGSARPASPSPATPAGGGRGGGAGGTPPAMGKDRRPGWSWWWGEVHLQRDASGPQPGMLGMAGESDSAANARTKTVRFVAHDVHHFGWSTSPEYRYEGALYDGRVAVHVLYQPGDEPQWGNGQ